LSSSSPKKPNPLLSFLRAVFARDIIELLETAALVGLSFLPPETGLFLENLDYEKSSIVLSDGEKVLNSMDVPPRSF
jgi:hypothetical protein